MSAESTLNQKTYSLVGEFLNVSEEEQMYVLKTIISGLNDQRREALLSVLKPDSEALPNFPLHEIARNRLYDETINLTDLDKVMLAVTILKDLYDLEEFKTRQITQTLKDTGNETSNTGASVARLVEKGFLSSSSEPGSHNSYQITGEGIAYTMLLVERPSSALVD